MKRHIAAAAVVAPAALFATALPAQAAPAHTHSSAAHSATITVVSARGAASLHALRSSTQKCAGTSVVSETVIDRVTHKLVGELDVYTNYTKSNTTYSLTACLRHAGASKGVRAQTSVTLVGAQSRKAAAAGKYVVGVKAYGNFVSYAGPAGIGGFTTSRFAVATGSIKLWGRTIQAEPLELFLVAK